MLREKLLQGVGGCGEVGLASELAVNWKPENRSGFPWASLTWSGSGKGLGPAEQIHKYKMRSSTTDICRDAGPDSRASSGWAFNTRDCSKSPLSQLREVVPSSLPVFWRTSCAHRWHRWRLHHFQLSPDSVVLLYGKSPFCRACGWSCWGWGSLTTRCTCASVPISTKSVFNFLTSLLSTFLNEPSPVFFSKHNTLAFVFKSMPAGLPNKTQSWIRTNWRYEICKWRKVHCKQPNRWPLFLVRKQRRCMWLLVQWCLWRRGRNFQITFPVFRSVTFLHCHFPSAVGPEVLLLIQLWCTVLPWNISLQLLPWQ